MDENLEYKRIGARIREIRLQKKMSQSDLAVQAHISLPHVSDIERGKSKMMLSTFVRITEALQVSADVLLRPDVPEVNGIYRNEFSDILADCTPSEIDSILRIVKELKETLHNQRQDQD